MTQRSCLVVDDSLVVRKAARRIVEGLGFTVREAKDGQEALDACRESLPDGVLLDWNMPVMDGIAFLAPRGRSSARSDRASCCARPRRSWPASSRRWRPAPRNT